MRIIEPSIVIEDEIDGKEMLRRIERAGRTCYKSEDRISGKSSLRFIEQLLKRGHESVLEHEKITVRIICDRGVTHELVRHRIASYSQESTRYCNYSKDKFGNELTFIRPCFWQNGSCYELWRNTMQHIEEQYFVLLENGAKPEEARSILPNSIKTEIVATMNLRQWRHFFSLRMSEAAHPQMRQTANMLLCEFKKEIPVVFDEFEELNIF